MLWNTEAMIEAMRARPLGSMPAGVTGISIDSRSLQPGDAFFAITGDRVDGHRFLTPAAKSGAALHVVAERKLPAMGGFREPLLVVDDVLAALGRLGEAARARTNARVVAVTGSVGKTSIKDALRHGLSALGPTHASVQSFNNHWGVPLSLARMPASTDYAVFEIGMNHPGEIRPLVKTVRPHAALITLIAPAHIGQFRDLDEIAQAKAEIFEGVEPGGTALLNADDPKTEALVGMARQAGIERIATFGEAEGADARLLAFEADGDGVIAEADVGGSIVEFDLTSGGRHTVQNALGVLATARALGADVGAVAKALSGWQAVKGRGARHRLRLSGGEATLIDESYNANPASIRAALDELARTSVGESGRRIAVLGDMRELGSHSAAFHAALAEPVEAAKVDRLCLVGEEMKPLEEALGERLTVEWHPDVDSLLPTMMTLPAAGDALVLKASNSLGFGRIVSALLEAHPPAEPVVAEPVAAEQPAPAEAPQTEAQAEAEAPGGPEAQRPADDTATPDAETDTDAADDPADEGPEDGSQAGPLTESPADEPADEDRAAPDDDEAAAGQDESDDTDEAATGAGPTPELRDERPDEPPNEPGNER